MIRDTYAAKSLAMNALYRGESFDAAAQAAGASINTVRGWAKQAGFKPAPRTAKAIPEPIPISAPEKLVGEFEGAPATIALPDPETLTSEAPASATQPDFKPGDLIMIADEDDEPLASMVLRVSAHEAGHAVIAKACTGLPARSRVWINEDGDVQGVTKRRGELSPAQAMLVGLAGAVGEAIALYPDMPLAENLDRIYAGLNADDAATAGVPHHADQPDWEPTPEFAQAVETITTLLTGLLADEWREMVRDLIETVEE